MAAGGTSGRAGDAASSPQVGSLLLVGMGLFCGSCYAFALTGNPSVKYGAPFGGTVLILAWLSVLL